METATTSRSAPEDSQGPKRALQLTALAVGLCVVLVVLLLVGLRIARSGVLPGVHIDTLDVSGLSEPELRDAVEQLREEREGDTVTATAGDSEVNATAEDLGYALDTDATVDAAWRRGRQGNPLAALGDHIRAFSGAIAVAPVETVDDDALAAWVEEAAHKLELSPSEGTVEFNDGTVVRIEPKSGALVDAEALRSQTRQAVLEPGPERIEVRTEPVEPLTTSEDIDSLFVRAQRAVSAPVRLYRNDGAIVLDPAQIGNLLSVERVVVDDEVRLSLTADAAGLDALVDSDTRDALEADPVDARFEVSDGEVSIVESTDGFAFDPEAAAEQLAFVADRPADGGVRQEELAGEIIAPDRTTAELEALEIVEQVSSFTTQHACCQGRVTNIQRFADLVRGVVLEPGEEFSLNGHVGPRTREKGFVDGGAIFRGEFIDAVGGGISQFATTFFNAAYFGGYEILEHQPHSYYISRYPAGRESTINYPTIDVRIRNDSPHGLLVHTRYTSTSITVDFYGKEWADVSSSSGARTNVTEPPDEFRENPDLEPGTSEVVQSGRQGFDITVTRTIDYHNGDEKTERYFTRYRPEPRIIERNPHSPDPDPEEEADPEEQADPEEEADPDQDDG